MENLDKLWPLGTRVDAGGELWLGGCAASGLAVSYGTPLYVFDETTLRTAARAYRGALAEHYAGRSAVAYAAKAYFTTALAQLFAEEGLELDVVSGGELYVALEAGFPPDLIHFHGNNKTPGELVQAMVAGVGRIVVDNLAELDLLAELLPRWRPAEAEPLRIWLRLAPGIDAHTHSHIQTGRVDTKFGLSIDDGAAEAAVARALATPGLALVGLHAHIGSQIYDTAPLAAAAGRLAAFAGDMARRYAFRLEELSPGGGWGVPMTEADPAALPGDYVQAVAQALTAACAGHDLPLPRLVLEPGRSLVGPAAVALYRIGAVKEIPGVRTYVSVDGGMADNIRPALYGATYTARIVGDTAGRRPQTVTVAGRFCESGDILVKEISLPRPASGDLLAIPMAGAYTLAMASNYNLVRRPAVVLVNKGRTRLIQRRESYAELAARDVPLARPATGSGRLRFAKYHGMGNDYLVIEPADFPDPPAADLVRRLCDRHRGPGADGVLWGPTADREPFALRLYNPDGGEFGISGNGTRIFARYLWDQGLPAGPDFEIRTPAGLITAHVLDDRGDRIAFDMGQISFDSQAIPAAGPHRPVVAEILAVAGREYTITAASIGNPHCVVFLEAGAVTPATAHALGPLIETHPLFPERTNVQFAAVLDAHNLRIEIWERGAGYTLSSGTSSCAAAAAAVRTGRCVSPITVHMPGGDALVEIAADWSVRLTGSVTPVCRGEISADLL